MRLRAPRASGVILLVALVPAAMTAGCAGHGGAGHGGAGASPLVRSLDRRAYGDATGERSAGESVAARAGDGPVGAPASAELERFREEISRGDASALQRVGLSLGRGGATEIDGSPAPDERIVRVDLPVRDANSAAIVVRSSCGNVWLLGLHREGTAWQLAGRQALVPLAEPGRCVRTTAVVQSLALLGDPARELAVGVRWESATGDEVQGPFLWVAGLDARQGLTMLLERAPFGATDDRTGANTEGALAIIDELPPPRPLFVEIRPAGRGTEGASPGVRVVRRYEHRGGRFELADEQRASVVVP